MSKKSLIIKKLIFGTISHKSIAVLGAGPSILNNWNKILEWCEQNDAVTIVSNPYKYPKIDYISIYSPKKIINFKNDEKIIICSKIKKTHFNKRSICKIYRISDNGKNLPYLWDKKITRLLDNYKLTFNPKSSGILAIMAAYFMSPSKILISGFDGYDVRCGSVINDHLNGKFHEYKRTSKLDIAKRQWIDAYLKLFLFLKKENIDLYCIENSKMKGISQEELHKAGFKST